MKNFNIPNAKQAEDLARKLRIQELLKNANIDHIEKIFNEIIYPAIEKGQNGVIVTDPEHKSLIKYGVQNYNLGDILKAFNYVFDVYVNGDEVGYYIQWGYED